VKRRGKSAAPHTRRMFAEPEAETPSGAFLAHIDGASRGNPGPSAYAALIHRPDGTLVCALKKYLGRATNNVAEYMALIGALDYASEHGIRRLRVRSDSELLVQQMRGLFRVRSAALAPLFERARKMAASLEYFSIEHVPREANREADRLANAILDQTERGIEERAEDLARTRTRESKSPTIRLSPAADPASQGEGPQATRKVRARFSGGALHPLEPVGLDEGEEVEITVRRKKRE